MMVRMASLSLLHSILTIWRQHKMALKPKSSEIKSPFDIQTSQEGINERTNELTPSDSAVPFTLRHSIQSIPFINFSITYFITNRLLRLRAVGLYKRQNDRNKRLATKLGPREREKDS